MTLLSLRLLGAFNVERDGNPLNGFATDKARALLAYLAVERERPHRRESLSALLWPDQNDERARQSLRQALSHLKQTLGGDEFLLVSPQDIQLHPQASVSTDIREVEVLSHACEAHRHRGIERCLPCLRRQETLLALYAGDFLAGFPSQNSDNFEEWVILTRERLHQQAMNAHIALANLNERRGDLSAALRHARKQITLEPWREEAHRQAMRLLALSGERSQALAQYQTCQRVIEAELAAAPTSETTALHQAIQNGTFPENSARSRRAQPPEPPTSFIGRAREQAEIAERLSDPSCRLVTILGMGGMGKSRLALQVAHTHEGLYRDGIYFIPLVAASDVPSAIASALGYTASDASSRLPDLLRDKELLLVLDNFEHLVETSETLSNLLEASPGLQLLVTSRERLRLREEWVYTLEGLSYPGKGEQVDSQAFDSLALFESRAAQSDSRFRLTSACLADITAICQLVEGQPLAIELAASAVAERPCSELAESLRQTFDALAPALRNFPARHRSLRAVFEHSWNLLSSGEQIRLANLSVFVGGFSAQAALTVAETSTQQLNELAAKSLLRCETDERYALHETIRQFATEKLENSGAARQSHAEYYAALTAQCNGAASAAALDLLQIERANLRTAWDWSLPVRVDLTASLLTGLSLLYSLRGPLSEGEALFREALQSLGGDIPKGTSPQSTLGTQRNLKNSANSAFSAVSALKSKVAIELARIYNAQTRHDEAIELAKTITGEPVVQARAWLTQGQALSAQGECEAARPVLEQSLALARELGEKRIEADSLRELGNAANRLTDYEVAIPLYQQSLTLARELDDKRGESATLNNWASVEWELGELDAARAHFLEALALYRELGNRLGESKALNNLSNVAADQGDLGVALHYCEQALRIHREMGNPRGQSAALNNLGATYYSLGQYDAARKSYHQALKLYRESGNHQAEGETLANLSLLDCMQDRLADGRKNASAAIGLAEAAGDKVNLANAFYYLGRIELTGGNFEAAEAALNRALALRREVPRSGRTTEILVELAYLALSRSHPVLALEILTPRLDALQDESALDGADDPYRIYGLAARVLAANGDPRAEIVRASGESLFRERAEKISDPAYRQSFEAAQKYFSKTESIS